MAFLRSGHLSAAQTHVALADSHRMSPQLWEKFRPGQTPPSTLGASRDYNVDMVPKFIMANGNLVKVSHRQRRRWSTL